MTCLLKLYLKFNLNNRKFLFLPSFKNVTVELISYSKFYRNMHLLSVNNFPDF